MDRERVRLFHIDDCRKLGQGKWEIRLGYIKRRYRELEGKETKVKNLGGLVGFAETWLLLSVARSIKFWIVRGIRRIG